jgi:hypothetical protein
MRTRLLPLAILALAACSPKGDGDTDTAAGAVTTDTAAAAASTSDPDQAATTGGNVPAGYSARTDRPNQQISTVAFTPAANGAMEITTGPAHILWRTADTASGRYTARATIEQLAKPEHAEAFGLIVGGQDLSGAGQRYTYFIVRGDGRYMINVREGASVRPLVEWTESASVPKQDAQGVAKYELAVESTADSLRFMVNGKRAGAVARQGIPADGIVGLRVNHNLRVRTTPVTVTKS